MESDEWLAGLPPKVQRRADENKRRYAEAASGLLAELAELGYDYTTLGELRNSGSEYRDAVSILIDWLPKIEYAALKSDVIRTLGAPWASAACPCLVMEFRKPDQGRFRWTIANTLSLIANKSVFEL